MKGRGFEHSCGKIWICPWDTQFFHGDTPRIHHRRRLLALLALAAEQTRDRRHGTKKQTHCGAQGWKKMKQIRVFFWCYCWMKFAIWVVLLKVPVKMSSKTMFPRAVFTSIHILSSYIHIATLGININRFWINIIPTLSTWIFFVVSHESKSNTVALQAYPQDSQRQAACCGSRWRRAGSWSFYTELSVTGKSIIDTYSIIVVNSSK